MPGAASASVLDLTPTGGYQLKLVGSVRKKVGGVNPLRRCRKSLGSGLPLSHRRYQTLVLHFPSRYLALVFTISSRLFVSDHVTSLISKCSQTLYALTILRAHGLCDLVLQSVSGQSSSPGCYMPPVHDGGVRVYVVVWPAANSSLHTSRSLPWLLSY